MLLTRSSGIHGLAPLPLAVTLFAFSPGVSAQLPVQMCLTLQLPVSSPCSATRPTWWCTAAKSSVPSMNVKTNLELTPQWLTLTIKDFTQVTNIWWEPHRTICIYFSQIKQNKTNLLGFIRVGAQPDCRKELESDIPLCSALRVLTLPRQMEYVLLCTTCHCEQEFPSL